MKKLLLFLISFMTISVAAQDVTVKWTLSDKNNLSNATIEGDAAYTQYLSTTFLAGAQIGKIDQLVNSGAAAGYTGVTYDPPFTSFTPTTNVSGVKAGHNISFGVTPASGHTFKVKKICIDIVRVGTDVGNVELRMKESGGTEKVVSSAPTIFRNKIQAGNSTGYGHNEFNISDMMVDSKMFVFLAYFYGLNGIDNENPKAMAFRNVIIEGVVDEPIFDVSHYLSDFTAKANTGAGVEQINLYNIIKSLKNGETARLGQKIYGDPTDFAATLQSALNASQYSVVTAYNATTHNLNVKIKKDGVVDFEFNIGFVVSNSAPKGKATPLKRGLSATYLGNSGASGCLVSWRSRSTDDYNYRFRLFWGTSLTNINSTVNNGAVIQGKTNFLHTSGASGRYYRLDVIDGKGNIVERDTCVSWTSQVKAIDLEGGAPTDIWKRGATYSPNDASICDMDGDGEYEIILKWSPSNEKDAASDGTTSPEYFACYKMDGTRLWILTGGPNMFSSAHTSSFVAWDFDGDGYGELMLKTGHGAIDGEGNYLSIDNDPTGNYLGGRGKQESGEEWITVFDGRNGAELKTINYHTKYADETTGFWGDSKMNRSERYLACIAWLDGKDSNPSGIFARGYYAGAKIGAYDWDGTNLTLRWLHRGASESSGTVTYANGTVKNLSATMYGEGAHWIGVADVNKDGKQEIVYGSSAMKSDGTTLYRTGLKHGDALHVGDFDPNLPGLETFMAHEDVKGIDYRDAKGNILLRRDDTNSDTGRGMMANFDPESDRALWQASAWGAIYDQNNNVVIASKTWGGGAAEQDRIYWTGTLADDFWGKGVIETWNPNSNTFDRLLGCVNGQNFTSGTTNNGTKNNACLLADICGDWREEVLLWGTGGTTGYQLLLNATSYTTDYIVPHLMDDFDYRAQVIGQNDCYNQPPHLGYNLRHSKKVSFKGFEVEPTEGLDNLGTKLGKYWGCATSPYPLIIPEDVVVWQINARTATNGVDTVKTTRFNPGKVIAANTTFIFNSKTPTTPLFAPTAKTANLTSTSYGKGFICDSTVVDGSATKFVYEFRMGNRGLGFYHAPSGISLKGGDGYGAFTGNSTNPLAESYVLGPNLNPAVPTGIIEVISDEMGEKNTPIYNIQGIRLKEIPTHGIYIRNGRKYVVE